MSETRSRARQVVEDMLRAEHGHGAMTTAPASATLPVMVTRPVDYLAAVAAARALSAAADGLAREYAAAARGEGSSWEQLADALDLPIEEGQDRAVETFRWVAPHPPHPFDTRSLRWECASCGARVHDTGPYAAHPDDNETGHAPGCPRYAADIAAWKQHAGWDDED